MCIISVNNIWQLWHPSHLSNSRRPDVILSIVAAHLCNGTKQANNPKRTTDHCPEWLFLITPHLSFVSKSNFIFCLVGIEVGLFITHAWSDLKRRTIMKVSATFAALLQMSFSYWTWREHVTKLESLNIGKTRAETRSCKYLSKIGMPHFVAQTLAESGIDELDQLVVQIVEQLGFDQICFEVGAYLV